MENLPEHLFSNVRQYLSFVDLHATRRVAKHWVDTSDVPKVLVLDPDIDFEDIILPPEHADYSKVYELYCNFEDLSEPVRYCKLVLKILRESNMCLQLLKIREQPLDLFYEYDFPSLPKLTNCTFTLCPTDIADIVINMAPNIRYLQMLGMCDVCFDFKKLSNLKEIDLYNVEVKEVINANDCSINWMCLTIEMGDLMELSYSWNDGLLMNLRTIELDIHLDHAPQSSQESAISIIRNWFEMKPNLIINNRVYLTVVHNRASLHMEISFTSGKFIITECTQCVFDDMMAMATLSAKLKEELRRWARIKPFTFEIHPKIAEEKKQKLFLLVNCTMLFSFQELREIICKASH